MSGVCPDPSLPKLCAASQPAARNLKGRGGKIVIFHVVNQQEMENQNNKVILLITDGQENEEPYIADVMDDVVQSGSRVVTISYG